MMERKHIHEKQLMWAFIMAPLFAFLVAAGLYAMDRAEMRSNMDVYETGNSRILALLEEARDRADLTVVVWGDSRLRHALTVGFDPEALVDMPDGRQLAILQYGIDGAGFAMFAGMADEVLAMKPDYLVVMPPVLSLVTRNPSWLVGRAVDITGFLNRKKNRMDIWDAWYYERHYIIEDKCYDNAMKGTVERTLAGREARATHDLSAANGDLAKARDFLRRAHEAGIKVVMLDIASNRAMAERLGFPLHRIDYLNLGHTPSRSELLPGLYDEIVWLSYDPGPDGSLYCDIVHFNEEGRKNFTNWFLRQF